MITVKHPTLPTTRQVKRSDVAGWTAAGWVRVPKKDAESAEKSEAKTEAAKK